MYMCHADKNYNEDLAYHFVKYLCNWHQKLLEEDKEDLNMNEFLESEMVTIYNLKKIHNFSKILTNTNNQKILIKNTCQNFTIGNKIRTQKSLRLR